MLLAELYSVFKRAGIRRAPQTPSYLSNLPTSSFSYLRKTRMSPDDYNANKPKRKVIKRNKNPSGHSKSLYDCVLIDHHPSVCICHCQNRR